MALRYFFVAGAVADDYFGGITTSQQDDYFWGAALPETNNKAANKTDATSSNTAPTNAASNSSTSSKPKSADKPNVGWDVSSHTQLNTDLASDIMLEFEMPKSIRNPEVISDPAKSSSQLFEHPSYINPRVILSGGQPGERTSAIAEEAKASILERMKQAYLLKLWDAEAISRGVKDTNSSTGAPLNTTQWELKYTTNPGGEKPRTVTDIHGAKDAIEKARTLLQDLPTEKKLSSVRKYLDKVEKIFAKIFNKGDNNGGTGLLQTSSDMEVQLTADEIESTLLKHLPWENRIRRMGLDANKLSVNVRNYPGEKDGTTRLPMTQGLAEFNQRFPQVLEFMSTDKDHTSIQSLNPIYSVDNSKLVVDTNDDIAGFRHYDDVARGLEHQATVDSTQGRFLMHKRWFTEGKSMDFPRFIKEYGAVFLKNLAKSMSTRYDRGEAAVDLTSGTNFELKAPKTSHSLVQQHSSVDTDLRDSWDLDGLIDNLIIQDRSLDKSTREMTVDAKGELDWKKELFSHHAISYMEEEMLSKQGSPWEDKLWDSLHDSYSNASPESFAEGMKIESDENGETSLLQQDETSNEKLLHIIAKKVDSSGERSDSSKNAMTLTESKMSKMGVVAGANQGLWHFSRGPCQNPRTNDQLPCSGSSSVNPSSKLGCECTFSSTLQTCRAQCARRPDCFAVEFLQGASNPEDNCNLRLVRNQSSHRVASEATVLAETMRMSKVDDDKKSSLAETADSNDVHCWVKALADTDDSPVVESYALRKMSLMQDYMYIYLPKLDMRRRSGSFVEHMREAAEMGKGKKALSDLSRAYERQHSGKKLWGGIADLSNAFVGDHPRIIKDVEDAKSVVELTRLGPQSLAESAVKSSQSQRTLIQIRTAQTPAETTTAPQAAAATTAGPIVMTAVGATTEAATAGSTTAGITEASTAATTEAATEAPSEAPTPTPTATPEEPNNEAVKTENLYIGNFIMVYQLHHRNGTALANSITNPTNDDLDSETVETIHDQLKKDVLLGGTLLDDWKPFYGMCVTASGQQTVASATEQNLEKNECRDHCMASPSCKAIYFSPNKLCFRINDQGADNLQPALGAAEDAEDGECWIKAVEVAKELNTTQEYLNKVAAEEATKKTTESESSLLERMREYSGLEHAKKVDAIRKMVRHRSYMKPVDLAKSLLEEAVIRNVTQADPTAAAGTEAATASTGASSTTAAPKTETPVTQQVLKNDEEPIRFHDSIVVSMLDADSPLNVQPELISDFGQIRAQSDKYLRELIILHPEERETYNTHIHAARADYISKLTEGKGDGGRRAFLKNADAVGKFDMSCVFPGNIQPLSTYVLLKAQELNERMPQKPCLAKNGELRSIRTEADAADQSSGGNSGTATTETPTEVPTEAGTTQAPASLMEEGCVEPSGSSSLFERGRANENYSLQQRLGTNTLTGNAIARNALNQVVADGLKMAQDGNLLNAITGMPVQRHQLERAVRNFLSVNDGVSSFMENPTTSPMNGTDQNDGELTEAEKLARQKELADQFKMEYLNATYGIQLEDFFPNYDVVGRTIRNPKVSALYPESLNHWTGKLKGMLASMTTLKDSGGWLAFHNVLMVDDCWSLCASFDDCAAWKYVDCKEATGCAYTTGSCILMSDIDLVYVPNADNPPDHPSYWIQPDFVHGARFCQKSAEVSYLVILYLIVPVVIAMMCCLWCGMKMSSIKRRHYHSKSEHTAVLDVHHNRSAYKAGGSIPLHKPVRWHTDLGFHQTYNDKPTGPGYISRMLNKKREPDVAMDDKTSA